MNPYLIPISQDGKRLYDSKRWKFIVEQDHYTLLIYEVGEEDKGVYECIVVNKLGKATCSARLNAEGMYEYADFDNYMQILGCNYANKMVRFQGHLLG